MKTSNITPSEWEVMKALWENDYLTAGEIVKEVNKDKDWAKTTINSFIQRLLEKGYVSFKHDNRYREYYALHTEKECVIDRMKTLTKSIYGATLNLETKYFEFYGVNDSEYLATLKENADTGYERITSILKFKLYDKQPIHLHRTQKRFHSVMGNPNGPSWYRASFIWGMIHMSPLECFKDITAEKALMHVFTQLLLSHLNENLPYYLHQGVSAYLAGWLDEDRIRKALSENEEYIDLNALRSFVFDIHNFKSSAGYEISYSFVSYIVSKFGIDAIRKMVDAPYDLPSLFDIDELTLIQEFKQYIHDKYL